MSGEGAVSGGPDDALKAARECLGAMFKWRVVNGELGWDEMMATAFADYAAGRVEAARVEELFDAIAALNAEGDRFHAIGSKHPLSPPAEERRKWMARANGFYEAMGFLKKRRALAGEPKQAEEVMPNAAEHPGGPRNEHRGSDASTGAAHPINADAAVPDGTEPPAPPKRILGMFHASPCAVHKSCYQVWESPIGFCWAHCPTLEMANDVGFALYLLGKHEAAAAPPLTDEERIERLLAAAIHHMHTVPTGEQMDEFKREARRLLGAPNASGPPFPDWKA